MTIFNSASKLVFLVLTLTACAGFILNKLPVDQFMILAIAASSFYFSNKGDSSQPYAGK
ncbi:MAG: hypothetical protein AB203_01810 [Parcubacteria bacterium C7867-008]|nr:MAG: hypothetical protein AB203_01810 [Parcubacteria bacterium C7867-008]